MSCVHYKFKSSLGYDTIAFENLHVSVKELREAICKAKKIGQSTDHKLEIVNAQTKKKYEDEQEMIPRNTSVIVQRVPVANTKAKEQSATGKEKLQLFPQSESSKLLSAEEMMQNKLTDLATVNATEEEKLKVMMSQSGEGFDPSKYPSKHVAKQPITGQIRVPPPNYVCFRCGQRGHWLRFCPTQGDMRYDNVAVKPLAGIPSSQLVTLNHHVPGAMIDRHGNYVMRSVDYEAMLKRAKSSVPISKEAVPIPDELKCGMCSQLMKDAVIIPCCGESFCDNCIREYLLEHDFTCPECSETDVSPDTLMANKALRTAVNKYQNASSDNRMSSFSDVTMVTAAVSEQECEKHLFAAMAPTTSATMAIATSTAMATTAYNTVTPSVTASPDVMTTATNKKAALQLVSQLEHNLKVKQAASSAAQEVISSDVFAGSSSELQEPTVTCVTRSVSPTKQQAQSAAMTTKLQTAQQTPIISQPVVTAAVTSSTSSVAAAAFTSKQALLPTPSVQAPVAATTAIAPAAPPAAPQLDPYAVAAAAALLLASGGTSSKVSTAPDHAALLAADQLLQQELNSRSRSPVPLTAEEFYRQQKRLKIKNKRKHSSSASSSPTRTRKRKHHHGNKSEKKKHKEHKSRDEKSSHKHKRKKTHKECHDPPTDQGSTSDTTLDYKTPHTRSAVTIVKKPGIVPDLESPLLPPCIQNFTEPPQEMSETARPLEVKEFDTSENHASHDSLLTRPSVESPAAATCITNTVSSQRKNINVLSCELVEDDGIEEGEILESASTSTATCSATSKNIRTRKLKRRPSPLSEPLSKHSSSHGNKMKKRKWKKDKGNNGEKSKKH